MKSLSAQDREFFELVESAGFSNPFSAQRHNVDLAIAGLEANASREKAIQSMLAQVNKRMHRLGDFKLRDFAPEDRQPLKMAVLFQLFHQFADHFDAHIKAQAEAGHKPLKLACGPEIIRALDRYGYTEVNAGRVISFFFQIRRAFTFLSRNLVGESRVMRNLRERAWGTVFTQDLALYERLLWNRLEDFSTFLIGETGTGKGVVAKALGQSGWIEYDVANSRFEHSFTSAFVPVNLSQFAETLLESELFGHVKGAFTGAEESREGVFKQCQTHGTIFLDELGEVSIPIQIKLLRVLQERVFSPVGSREQLAFQGRVIAATNQPVHELRADGRFRDDFYYRLCSDVIEIPPLRERIAQDPDELTNLVEHLVTRIVGGAEKVLSDQVFAAIDRLGPDYAWPGNVRELEQCIRQVVVRGTYDGDRKPRTQNPLTLSLLEDELDANQLLSHYCHAMYQKYASYEEVGRRLGLDRRTVKKYVVEFEEINP